MATPPAGIQFPVEIIGSDLFGQQFFEQARILTIHRNGISILLANKLAPDSEVILRNPETNLETVASVVGQIRKEEAGEVYGLAFLDPSGKFWAGAFPAGGATKVVRLECGGCHSVSAVSLSGIQLEMFEAARELALPCKSCKNSRTWRETDRDVTAPNPEVVVERSPGPTAGELPRDDRRRSRRTAIKAFACVRFSGEEIVVTCEDVSKGGFRFTGRKEFPEGTRIEAAVPYTKDSSNIFSPACVVFCRCLPDGRFRHGVAYTKATGLMGWDRS